MLAIISGSVAFLAPEIGIEPLSGRPPTIRMRSICAPERRKPALTLRRLRPLVGEDSGGIVGPGFGLRPLPRLRFAPLQIFPKRRAQALRPRLVALAGAGPVAGWAVVALGHDRRASPLGSGDARAHRSAHQATRLNSRPQRIAFGQRQNRQALSPSSSEK